MKVKVELEKNETIEDANEFLAKAEKLRDHSISERYPEDWLNELEAHVNKLHAAVLNQISEEVKKEIS